MKAVNVIALSILTSISLACRETKTEIVEVPKNNTVETETNGNSSSGTDDQVTANPGTTNPQSQVTAPTEQQPAMPGNEQAPGASPSQIPSEGVANGTPTNPQPVPQTLVQVPTPAPIPSVTDTAGQAPLIALNCKNGPFEKQADGRVIGKFSCKMTPSKSLKWAEDRVVNPPKSLLFISGDSAIDKTVSVIGKNEEDARAELVTVKLRVFLLKDGVKWADYVVSTKFLPAAGQPSVYDVTPVLGTFYNCTRSGEESSAIYIYFHTNKSFVLRQETYKSTACNANTQTVQQISGDMRNFKLLNSGELTFQILDQNYLGKKQNLDFEFTFDSANRQLLWKTVTGDQSGEHKLNMVLKKL